MLLLVSSNLADAKKSRKNEVNRNIILLNALGVRNQPSIKPANDQEK